MCFMSNNFLKKSQKTNQLFYIFNLVKKINLLVKTGNREKILI